MAVKNKIPEIRFKGFADLWNEFKLGEMAKSFEYGLNAAAIEYDGINKYLRITDINDETREFNTNALTSPGTNLSIADNYKLNVGDLLFTRTGASVGKTYHYKASDGLVYYAGFLIRARINPEFDVEFVFQNTLTNKYNNFIRLTSQRSGQPGVNAQEYSIFNIMVPKLNEQHQIGTFFKNLDHLLTLHQQKLDKLVTIKKAMLEKMFPKEGANVPEIRFKGFTEDWENRKYIESFTKIPNNTLSRAELNYNSGLAKNIHYGDVLIKFGELLDVKKDEIPYITDSAMTNKFNRSKLQNGDVIIADAAEDETVGKCTELVNVGEEIVVPGLHTIPSRPTLVFASGYLGYFMNSLVYHNQLLRLMQGTKVSSISKAALQDTIIFFPTKIEEQFKISRLFQQINRLITLHQRELEKLKNIKKGCLEKMFV